MVCKSLNLAGCRGAIAAQELGDDSDPIADFVGSRRLRFESVPLNLFMPKLMLHRSTNEWIRLPFGV